MTATARTCRGCAHGLRRGTCAEPVAAGLTQWFEIHWAPPGHAATCPAFVDINAESSPRGIFNPSSSPMKTASEIAEIGSQ